MEETKKIATLEDFQKPIPCQTKTVETDHFGTVLVRQFSRADANRIDAWLRPKGKLSDTRNKYRDLRIVTMSIVDAEGNHIFPFPDTKEGNQKFFAFAGEIEESSAEPWEELIYEVMVIQGYYKKVESLLGK